MNKTKVDDMLIEMIEPKVREIEEKFASGNGLSQDDINTLLLKSQYNHINHLDKKLDEIAEDNAQLRLEFETRMGSLGTKFEGLKTDFADLKTDFANLKTDIQQSINSTIKWYIGGAGVDTYIIKSS